MKKIIILILAQILVGQTGYDIAKAIDTKAKPKDMKTTLTMTLENARGKTRTSTIASISLEGGEKQIIWFLSPADDKGVAFLKIEQDELDDEMRLWLPAFKKVRRIKSSSKSDSFMGSDMSYEDMTNRNLEDFEYSLGGKEKIGETEYNILVSKPKDRIDSEYSEHKTWVSVKDNIVLKEESYDKAGRLLKTKWIKTERRKEYDVPVEIYVENIQKKHNTTLTFTDIDLDMGVSEDLFQEKNLKRLPPR